VTINLNQPLKPDLQKLTKYLEQVNNSGWYTNFGPLHQQLTKRLEEYLGVKNLLLVSNGTLALQVAYKTLNVTNALTTPFSFVATASSLIWQGIDTSFSDIDEKTYNLCPKQASAALASNPAIDTIVATHVYGNPCDISAFEQIAKQQNIKVIYDAAHAFGVKVDGESVLNFGDASTLSFHATKVFHTVEGGAIVFKHKVDYERAKRLINFGMDHNGNLTDVGINAKLNEYQCAVGLTILDQMRDVLQHRSALLKAYRSALVNVVGLPQWHCDSDYNGAYMPILLDSATSVERLAAFLTEGDVQSRRYFSPSLDQTFSKPICFGSETSQDISTRILCLPLHFYMTLKDINIVTKLVKKGLK